MGKTKILIVEDEWVIGNDLKDSLENIGYDVVEVLPSGEEAIQYMQNNKPDIVLMDIILQGDMNGIVAADKIQTCYKVPVIYLTAHSNTDTLDRAKLTNPFGYLVKPIKIREAHIIIEMAIAKHESERKLKESEEWFSTTLASIGDAVITTDTKGFVTFLNPVSLGYLELRLQDAIGKHFSEIMQILDSQTNREVESPVTTVIREKKVINFIDHILVNNSGRRIPIGDSVAPIKNGEDGVLGVVFVFSDISEKKRIEEEHERLIREREEAISKVKILRGLIPICAACKKIRDDKGYWNQLEVYIGDHSEAEFTHGMCPDCIKEYYPQLSDRNDE